MAPSDRQAEHFAHQARKAFEADRLRDVQVQDQRVGQTPRWRQPLDRP
jgi:hypothetical protein